MNLLDCLLQVVGTNVTERAPLPAGKDLAQTSLSLKSAQPNSDQEPTPDWVL